MMNHKILTLIVGSLLLMTGSALFAMERDDNKSYQNIRYTEKNTKKIWVNNGKSIDEFDLDLLYSRKEYVQHLLSKPEFQDSICNAFSLDCEFYSGISFTYVDNEIIEPHLLKVLDLLDLNYYSISPRRLNLLEMLIKSGCLEGVKKLTERLLHEYPDELPQYCTIMKKAGYTNHDNPIFWLPAITTRWDTKRVPEKKYHEIEEYLVGKLCPSGTATVNGNEVNREQYVENINQWKTRANKRLGKNRYTLTSVELPFDTD